MMEGLRFKVGDIIKVYYDVSTNRPDVSLRMLTTKGTSIVIPYTTKAIVLDIKSTSHKIIGTVYDMTITLQIVETKDENIIRKIFTSTMQSKVWNQYWIRARQTDFL
jgi:hypothetical protein